VSLEGGWCDLVEMRKGLVGLQSSTYVHPLSLLYIRGHIKTYLSIFFPSIDLRIPTNQ
jgi:hypothetical protein